MTKYKIGDKVRIRSQEDLKNEFGLDRNGDVNTKVTILHGSMKSCCGNVYTIESIRNDDTYYSFYFKETPFVFSSDSIEPIKKECSIVIYQKGDETIALDKSTGKIVHCGHHDDFYKDADVAFKRLVKKNSKPESKPKKYNDEIVCVESKTFLFTKGKIYKVVDGYVTNDGGVKEGKFEDFDSLNKGMLSKFIKVVK